MLVLNHTQFFHALQKSKAKAIYFYAGHGDVQDTEGKHIRPMSKLECSSVEALKTEAEEFANMYPEKFSCYIHTVNSAITTNGSFLRVDLAKASSPSESTAPASPTVIDEAAIIKRITKEIKTEASFNLQKAENVQYKLQIDHQQLAANKLGMVLHAFLSQLAGVPSPAMQGTHDQPEVEAEETEATDGQTEIQKAVDSIRRALGDETIIKLAKKIESDPNAATMIKSFL